MSDPNSYNLMPHGLFFVVDGIGTAEEMLQRGRIFETYQHYADALAAEERELGFTCLRTDEVQGRLTAEEEE